MSGAGERLHIPFSQSSTSRTPSHFLDISNPKSGDAPGIPHISLLDFVRGRDDLHPPLGPQRLHAQYFGTQGVILVRDPPRERLAGSWSSAEDDEPPSILARVAGKSDFVHQYHNQHYPTATRTTTTTSASSSVEFYTDLYQYHRDQQYAVKAPFNIISNSNNSIQPAPGDEKARMMKKRGSLQAIFVPSFLQGPLSPTASPPMSPTSIAPRTRTLSAAVPMSSYASTPLISASSPTSPSREKHARKRSTTLSILSSRSSPPPAFLIDDDPFANLTSAPSESLRRVPSESTSSQPAGDASPTSPVLPIPRSPLYEAKGESLVTVAASTASSPVPPIPGGRVQTRPAHQRPAFKTRPSLPSLDTLARMNVVLTKKVRKGRVGAGLPFEPWDDIPSDDESTPPASNRPTRRNTASATSILHFPSAITSSASSSINSNPSTIPASSDPPLPAPQLPKAIATTQPLLPTQLLALGSAAADVELVVPTSITLHPSLSMSTQAFPSQGSTTLPAPPASASDARPEKPLPSAPEVDSRHVAGYPVVEGPLRLSGLGDFTLSEVADAIDEALSPIEAESVESPAEESDAADFLERYHRASLNGSEEGISAPSAAAVPVFAETIHEEPEEEIGSAASVVNGVAAASEQSSVAYGDANHTDVEDEGELEEMSFASNYSYLYLDRYMADDSSVSRPNSILFSSPHSFTSLSRSLSVTSQSSRDSVDSAGPAEHTDEDDEDGDPCVFGSISPRQGHEYRHLADPNPSLSSLELDLNVTLGSDAERVGRDRGNSTRSSSSHPSLSRTRSSSDDSDVLNSPVADDYLFFPYRHAHSYHRHTRSSVQSALFSPQSAPITLEQQMSFNPETEASLSIRDEGVEAGWTNTFGEYQNRYDSLPPVSPGPIGSAGDGFGFGFDKLSLAAEVQEQKDGKEGLEQATLAPGTSTSTAIATNTTTVTTGSDADANCSSSDHHLATSAQAHDVPQTSIVQQATPPPTPDYLQTQFSQASMMPQPNMSVTRTKTSPTIGPTDGSGWDAERNGQGSRTQGRSSSSTSHRGGNSTGQMGSSAYPASYSTGFRGHRGRGRGNSDDEDEDEERRRRRALERGHGGETRPSPFEQSSDDESDHYGSSVAYQTRVQLERPQASRSRSRSPSAPTSSMAFHSPLLTSQSTKFPVSSAGSSRYVSEDDRDDSDDDDDDDDVPLAQRIPSALTAQKTIRRQFREEREQRKREKSLRVDRNAERRERQVTLRPAGAGVGPGVSGSGMSSSRDAAAIAVAAAASSTQPQRRQRTLTLPGKSPVPVAPVLNPHDLAQKLQKVQMAEILSPTYQQSQQQMIRSPQQFAHSPSHLRSKSISRPSGDVPRSSENSYPTPPSTMSTAISPALRARSVKEPSHSQRQLPPVLPSEAHTSPVPALRSMRSFHRPSEHSPSGIDEPRSLAVVSADSEQRTSRTRATSIAASRGSHEDRHNRSLSLSRRSEKPIPADPVPPLPMNARTSNDDQRKISRPRTASSAEAEHPSRPSITARNAVVAQQRVFVGNLQQFNTVEIGPTTTAGDVITMMDSEGALVGWAGTGGWMVFEVAQDFGMERPIRSYELLADVQSSWLKDKTVNYFILKLTPLAVPLARSAIPSSSPTHSGYVEWEAKKGKWSKRWVQLREHSLWLSKRDNRKDEVLICSLSNFDAYFVTRPHRAPKPFTFSIKSTDKLSFFENTSDYLHTFSCSEKDGRVWIEKILIARSYVLHQERNVLFNPKSSVSGPSGATVSRSGTRKRSSSAQRPAQPLLNLPPFTSAAQPFPHHDVFEPGSLLSKQP